MSIERLHLRGTSIEWREVEGEIVALDLDRQVYLAVNRTGATIWPSLAEGATRQQLVDCLVRRFDVEPQQAELDLDAFLDELRASNLLES